MRILFIGDVFGSIGRRVLAENLKRIRTENSIDVCIANGENTAGGKGITVTIVKKLHKYGVDIITGGNHSMAVEDVYKEPSTVSELLRPLNFQNNSIGIGKTIYQLSDGRKIGVINLIGRTFFEEQFLCPFEMGMTAVTEISDYTRTIFIDFHAEATSEKVCLANYLNGKASAVIGSHTHVQTADERILSEGTAYLTDAGMTGPEDSAIGMKLKQVIERFITGSHVRFEPGSRCPMFNGVVIDTDDTTGKARSIYRIYERINF